MRYSKGSDWVDITGAADLPMRDLDALYTATTAEAFRIAQGVVKAWHIVVKGADVGAVTLGEGAAAHEVLDVFGLPLRAWDWLRECILKSARDEVLDPEA